jgi:hypothetical protein
VGQWRIVDQHDGGFLIGLAGRLVNPIAGIDASGPSLTTGSGSAYVLTTAQGIRALHKGLRVIARTHAANTVIGPTLNVDGLGAKAILMEGWDAMPVGGLRIAQWTFEYFPDLTTTVKAGATVTQEAGVWVARPYFQRAVNPLNSFAQMGWLMDTGYVFQVLTLTTSASAETAQVFPFAFQSATDVQVVGAQARGTAATPLDIIVSSVTATGCNVSAYNNAATPARVAVPVAVLVYGYPDTVP